MSDLAVQRAVAVVDDAAVERNCTRLVSRLQAGARLCAVVKANGYGHGAVESARAALAGGAEWLAVATADEAAALRDHLPDAPILTMGALTEHELDIVLAAASDLAVWHPQFAALVAERGAELGVTPRLHVKHDTGMGRLGERDPEAVRSLIEEVAADDRLELAGVWTHFATADEPDSGFFDEQVDRFAEVAERVRAEHPGALLHAANSAAALRDPAAHYDLVRCGIAIYGLDPFQADPFEHGLEPALELRSYVADRKRFPAGASAGYGRRWLAPADTWVRGAADWLRRRGQTGLTNNAEALVEGGRYPLVGTVSMDNVTVDLGAEPSVERGAVAVLIEPRARSGSSARRWRAG